MKIGLKYCGGCNSRYDRTKEVEKLMRKFPQHTFTYNVDTEACDILLLICGCMTACPTADGIAAKQVFSLRTPKEFATFAQTLSTMGEAKEIQKRRLHIGEQASMQKTFSATDITAFANLTGDFGKMHVDAAFARQYGFGKPVIHGVLVGSLISSVMGMQLPGDGTILMDENLRFVAPVYVGDTITATVTLKSVQEQKRWFIGELYGTCVNQDGVTVVEGTCHQVMTKTLFTIETTEKD